MFIEGIKHFMDSLQYTYSVHASSLQLINISIWSWLKSTCRCQVKSSQMCSSRPPSTWGHFSLKFWSRFCTSATRRSNDNAAI